MLVDKILWSSLAENDLWGIETYIAEELGNPVAAAELVDGIVADIMRLERFPDMAPALNVTSGGFLGEYRRLVSHDHLIFYRHVGDVVYIDRILNGRMDWMRGLFGEGSLT